MRQQETFNTRMDSRYSWVVLANSFLSFLSYSCINASAGILQVEIMEDLQVGSGIVSIMTSLALGLPTVLGPLSGVLSNLLSIRYTIFIGTCMMSSGLMLACYSTSIEMLVFFYGVMTGVGGGLILCPCIVVVGLYFEKRRIFATGVVMCATGLGRLSIPYLVRYVIDHNGWRYCMAIHAGVILHILVFASFFLPTKVERRRMVKFKAPVCCHRETDSWTTDNGRDIIDNQNDEHQAGRGKLVMTHLNDWHGDSDTSGYQHKDDFAKDETCPQDEERCQVSTLLTASVKDTSLQLPAVQDVSLKESLKRICRNKLLWTMCIHCFFFMSGYGIYIIHFPAYVASKGLSPHHVTHFYTVSGISLLLIRLFGSALINRINPPLLPLLLCLEGVMGLFVGLCPIYASTVPGMFILEGCTGALYGQTYMLQSPLAAQLMPVEDLPMTYGMSGLFTGTGLVLAPTLAGFISEVTKTYDVPMYMAGSFLLIGASTLFAMVFMTKKQLDGSPNGDKDKEDE